MCARNVFEAEDIALDNVYKMPCLYSIYILVG